MRHELMLHPDSRCAAVQGVAVDISRVGADALSLVYSVRGRIDGVALPSPSAGPTRAGELWKHTCFELFLRDASGAYVEFNFSPSAQWAAYAFDAYREGMRNADVAAPLIETQTNAGLFTLNALVTLPLPAHARLAVTAVIEEADGALSYWSLAHGPGKPDFHHIDSFVLDLPEHP